MPKNHIYFAILGTLLSLVQVVCMKRVALWRLLNTICQTNSNSNTLLGVLHQAERCLSMAFFSLECQKDLFRTDPGLKFQSHQNSFYVACRYQCCCELVSHLFVRMTKATHKLCQCMKQVRRKVNDSVGVLVNRKSASGKTRHFTIVGWCANFLRR